MADLGKQAMQKTMIMSGVALAITSVISSLVTFGTYGYLTKKGWSSWKAGAAVGAIGGALALGTSLLSSALIPSMPGIVAKQIRGLSMQPMQGLTVTRVGQLPTVVAGLTVDKLMGCTTCR